MNAHQFKLPIGAKRQVTLPRAFMEMLSLREGEELLLETDGHSATLTPLVSVPRSALPEELRQEFEARRGSKATDIPLAEFLADIGHTPRAQREVSRETVRPTRIQEARRIGLQIGHEIEPGEEDRVRGA